jgi:transcriptional antiterminator NusG
MEMVDQSKLKPIAPYFIGQVVDYVPKPKPFCTVSGSWFVVGLEPQHTKLAKEELSDAGFVTYLPEIPCRERHGRGAFRTVYRPALGAYMLVKCEASPIHWQKIATSRGVRRLLGCDGMPKAIGEAEVMVVRMFEAEKEDQERARLAREEAEARAKLNGRSGIVWDFSEEERVRIKNGPFAGFYAELASAVDVHDRLRALVSLFGRVSVVELSAFDIERAT